MFRCRVLPKMTFVRISQKGNPRGSGGYLGTLRNLQGWPVKVTEDVF